MTDGVSCNKHHFAKKNLLAIKNLNNIRSFLQNLEDLKRVQMDSNKFAGMLEPRISILSSVKLCAKTKCQVDEKTWLKFWQWWSSILCNYGILTVANMQLMPDSFIKNTTAVWHQWEGNSISSLARSIAIYGRYGRSFDVECLLPKLSMSICMQDLSSDFDVQDRSSRY